MEGVSIIICCYNSGNRIAETLRYIADQDLAPQMPCEVILVNNASADDTVIRGIKAWESFSKGEIAFRIIEQPVPGLLHARKKGIEEASYDILVFCDDDNHLQSDYIRIAWKIMNERRDVGIAGGCVDPKLPFYPGRWIEANYAALAIGTQGVEPKYTDWVFGAGMVIRKQIYERLRRSGIDLMLSGRLRSKQTSGDDAEICQLARFIGYKVFYTPALRLGHQIAVHRLKKADFIKANYKNVFHAVYLYLLEELIREKGLHEKKAFRKFVRLRFMNIFYFGPRIFFGKNSFFSLMMLLQNLQLLLWLFKNRRNFRETFYAVRVNLYQGQIAAIAKDVKAV